MSKLRRENKNLTTENSLLKYELKALDKGVYIQTPIAQTEAPEYIDTKPSAPIAVAHTMDIALDDDRSKIKIKILSGDGKLNSAKNLAKTLQSLGYSINRVALAPSTKYSKTFVYYAKDYKREGMELTEHIGKDSQLRPLSWKSIFDIIIVTKNKRYK